jgi:hypothetical protein
MQPFALQQLKQRNFQRMMARCSSKPIILLNARAAQHVAVFGLSQEGRTLQECNQKVDTQVKDFVTQPTALGIKSEDVAVDYVAQNRIYDYEVAGDTATEKLTASKSRRTFRFFTKRNNGSKN